jgi:hypothetical protein
MGNGTLCGRRNRISFFSSLVKAKRKLYKAKDGGPNCYCRLSRLSRRKFRWWLRLFYLDIEATKTAQLTGLNRNSANLYLRHLWERIATLCEAESPRRGQGKIDESYSVVGASGGNGAGAVCRTCAVCAAALTRGRRKWTRRCGGINWGKFLQKFPVARHLAKGVISAHRYESGLPLLDQRSAIPLPRSEPSQRHSGSVESPQ